MLMKQCVFGLWTFGLVHGLKSLFMSGIMSRRGVKVLCMCSANQTLELSPTLLMYDLTGFSCS